MVATCSAKQFNKADAGEYKTTAVLYCRNDAGTNKKALCKIPAGTKVKCYGYYTMVNGVTTNVTTGGYVGSEMYKKNLENAKTIVNAAFQGSVLTHREYLCNAVANGRPSGGAWFDSSIELPNEPMMYGHLHFSPTSDGSTVPSIYTISKTQLALFVVCPRFIVNRSYNQWLRDVVSSATFAFVANDGVPGYTVASGSNGVRPVFPVG